MFLQTFFSSIITLTPWDPWWFLPTSCSLSTIDHWSKVSDSSCCFTSESLNRIHPFKLAVIVMTSFPFFLLTPPPPPLLSSLSISRVISTDPLVISSSTPTLPHSWLVTNLRCCSLTIPPSLVCSMNSKWSRKWIRGGSTPLDPSCPVEWTRSKLRENIIWISERHCYSRVESADQYAIGRWRWGVVYLIDTRAISRFSLPKKGPNWSET